MLTFLDTTPTFVVSATLEEPPRDDVTIIDAAPERIERLRHEGEHEGDVLVLGSPTLVRWLLAHDLLDELNITVLPIVVGVGTRLFENMPTTPVPLRLDGSQVLGSGALELHYTPAVNPRLTGDSSSTYG